MVLTARTGDGKVINARDFSSGLQIRSLHKKLYSPFPDCDIEVFPRDADNKVLHFVHKSKVDSEFATGDYKGGESQEHIEGKIFAANFMREWAIRRGEISSERIKIQYEFPILNKKRIADAVLLLDDVPLMFIECQLAAITPEELDERTDDYDSFGIPVYWFFGRRAATSANKDWAANRLGICYQIEVHQRSEAA